jgi:hypothetical protein
VPGTLEALLHDRSPASELLPFVADYDDLEFAQHETPACSFDDILDDVREDARRLLDDAQRLAMRAAAARTSA